MNILVTGANGFLGNAIVEILSRNDFEINGLSRSKIPSENNLKSGRRLFYFQADITNEKETLKLADEIRADFIIHTAGLAHQFGKITKERFWDVNVNGTENVAKLSVLLNCKRFILISSVAVYGNVLNDSFAVGEDTVCNPTSLYAQSKFESENICRRICVENQIPLTILRPSTIIGENDRGNVFRLIKIIDKGLFLWFGKGNNRKSLIYKKDVAAACLKIINESKENYECYNVTAEAVSMKFIVERIHEYLHKKSRKFGLPQKPFNFLVRFNNAYTKIGAVKKIEETLKKWQSDEVFSGESIEKKYGFKPEITVGDALKIETDWYLSVK